MKYMEYGKRCNTALRTSPLTHANWFGESAILSSCCSTATLNLPAKSFMSILIPRYRVIEFPLCDPTKNDRERHQSLPNLESSSVLIVFQSTTSSGFR